MSEVSSSIQHVSDTALWVAHYRAQEGERPDALFRDPFAKALVGERGTRIAASMHATSMYTAWTLVIRTCVIDEYVNRLIEEGIDTILNLGAGLDTRPYRMKLPASLQWIEVDYPHMIEHKEKVLKDEKPVCRLEQVKLDLADREKRKSFFKEMSARSGNILVITEGVIPYLSEEQVTELAEDLHAHPSFRFWIGEYFSPMVYPHLQSAKRKQQMKNAPFRFFPKDWFGLFASRGWVPRETKFLAEESLRLGRKLPMPWWFIFIRPFITKKRAKGFLRSSGYVLFVRA